MRVEQDERWRAFMRSAQDGDRLAYATLLSELVPMLRRLVNLKWPNIADDEDIVQEILVSLHKFRHTYDRNRPFTPWLLTIAKRRMADAARSRYARNAREIVVDRMPETFSSAHAKTKHETSDELEALRKALATLPPGQRQAVELLKIEGLSLEEAAYATGKSVASLKVSVHRALRSMRQIMERDHGRR
ncbi:MAG TPA: sigma-70 family RNA polymerase sigma factor [Methylocystis sp.]|nr:sigma-70 family RNA polymerase sigma factor [Methylocystis sp.]